MATILIFTTVFFRIISVLYRMSNKFFTFFSITRSNLLVIVLNRFIRSCEKFLTHAVYSAPKISYNVGTRNKKVYEEKFVFVWFLYQMAKSKSFTSECASFPILTRFFFAILFFLQQELKNAIKKMFQFFCSCQYFVFLYSDYVIGT